MKTVVLAQSFLPGVSILVYSSECPRKFLVSLKAGSGPRAAGPRTCAGAGQKVRSLLEALW